MISIHGPATSKINRFDPLYASLVEANRRLSRKDFTLWGDKAESEAKHRLNWIGLPTSSHILLPELDALHAKFRSRTRVILCGMGGSSLAPEVIASTYGKDLFVLDSTDPNYIVRALNTDLSKAIIVVSSKSGSTIETSSQRALFLARLEKENLDPKEHLIFVTDPSSPLDIEARGKGFTVINADPEVGGRFSALSAFGLVPSAILGIDVSVILDSASDALISLTQDDSPAIDLAYLLAYSTSQYCSLSDSDSGMVGLSDWIEQLVAESTGKDGVGRLPIVIESNLAPVSGVSLNIAFTGKSDLVVEASLGEHFILWEWVTSLVGYALQIDPFNQPNVTEAKEKTSALLGAGAGIAPALIPTSKDGSIDIYGTAKSTQEALLKIIDSVSNDGYIAIMAYLDREGDKELAQLRQILANRSNRPVTFGWGPRFLHSTGQIHKGGQQNGVFLQITGESAEKIEIPGENFSFNTLIAAQALGDAQTLTSRGRTVIRLHLNDRVAGISEILAAARAII